MTRERPELIINSRGDTKTVRPSYFIPDDNTIVFPDKRTVKIDWRRNFDRINAIQDIIKEADITQEEGDYNITLDRPDIPFALGVVFSDAHIGSTTSDHKLIRDILEIAIDTPNTFLVDAGDTFDDGIWGGLQFEQAIPPYMQRFTIKDIAKELGDKFGACVIGNHPEWIFNHTGQKPEHLFYEEVRGPLFAGMGLLHLKAGEVNYDIALAHTYWGKSKLNIHNVCHNLRKHEYPNADVFIVGHEHVWGYEKEMIAGKEILNLRPGTAKTTDRYARIHGIAKRGQQMGLGILFSTEKRQMMAMPLADAVSLMNI